MAAGNRTDTFSLSGIALTESHVKAVRQGMPLPMEALPLRRAPTEKHERHPMTQPGPAPLTRAQDRAAYRFGLLAAASALVVGGSTLAELGTVDVSVTADTAHYAVFDDSGTRTYTAFNPSAEVLTVTFFDGTTLETPVGETAVLSQGLR